MVTCIRPGCTRKVRARFLCRSHYSEALAGKAELPPHMRSGYGQPSHVRFFQRVEKTDTCWIWIGALSDTGYGSFQYDGQSNAHRWSYVYHVGPIPEGLQIDHLCRNRACVNPEHLEPVTTRENTRRGRLAEAIRARAKALTHCPHGHEKNDANTYRSFNKKRDRWEVVCRPCRNARLRRRAAEKRAAKKEVA